MVYLPRKPTFIVLIVLGVICIADGISKGDLKEILIMTAIMIYAIISLVNDAKKKRLNKEMDTKASNQKPTV